MATKIFLGEPPADIKQWIIEHSGPIANPKTVLTFPKNIIEEYDWSGEINQQTMINAGLYNGEQSYWIKGPKIVEIGSNVTSLGSSVFTDSMDLINVIISNNVTSIGSYAFYNSVNLQTITIGTNITNINTNAFSDCFGLTSVTFLGKTLAQVQAMANYPWGIQDTSIINVA